jgi:hypothetical protein
MFDNNKLGKYTTRLAEARRKKMHALQRDTKKHSSKRASQKYFSIIKVAL